MTVITDVPQSGIYFQKGAIVQLVAQLLDANTGLPVPLQTATGLTISILYPDGTTSQTFPAFLYTDGSDGMIYCITRNNGVTIDLSQTGLYQMQGNGIIGSVALPPSYLTDFYVLANVTGGAGGPISTPTGIVLYDSNSVRWVGTVDPSGNITWAAATSGPDHYLQFNSLVMKDDQGLYWTMTISTGGVVSGAASGSFAAAVNSFVLMDTNGKSWIITVTENGGLLAS